MLQWSEILIHVAVVIFLYLQVVQTNQLTIRALSNSTSNLSPLAVFKHFKT